MKRFFWFFLILLFFFRYISAQPHFQNGQILKISGRLFSEPNVGSKLVTFNLSGVKVISFGNKNIHYGDYLTLEGKWKDGVVVANKIEYHEISNNLFVNIRKDLINFFSKSLPEPHASLVSGIVIGAKTNLPDDFKKELVNTGTTHVVVASGMNVTMLVGFLFPIFIWAFGRRKSVLLIIITILFYLLITGFEAPIIRASVMAIIAFTALAFGKVANTLRYTLLTGILMLIAVPNWITDIGFLLSFATTISIILFQSKIDKALKFIPNIIRGDLTTSFAAQIGSAPIILFAFGQINLLSPFINAVVLWIIAPTMIIAGLAGILSFIFPGLAKLLILLCYPLTSWFIFIVKLFGS